MKTYTHHYLFLLGLSLIFLSSMSFAQVKNTSVPNTKDKSAADISKLENEDLDSFENSPTPAVEETEEDDVVTSEEDQTKKVVLSFPKWKYYTGATVGSVVGFGLGHLIQDRYTLDGAWKYSVIESALIGGMIFAYNAVDSGFDVLKGSSDNDVKPSTKNMIYSSMFGLLGVGLLSCKLFEITALWGDPKFNKESQNYDIYATKTRSGYSWDLKLTGISPDLKLAPGLFFSANF